HEAIPAINWPAMKMGFKVADPSLLNGLTVGDKVDFELKAEGENYIIIAVKPKNS
ncbi:TPA: copper-binding protein, partial [Escherichia coli]|nr:copper-binding protein [Escherichia coli]